jgi:hypothetical protein
MNLRHATALCAVLVACDPTPQLECSEASQITVYTDADGDGHGVGAEILACNVSTGFARLNDDCDDEDSTTHPEHLEICDGLDNDCDDEVDDGLREIKFYEDLDEDGFGNPDKKQRACAAPEGYVENNWDCNDEDANVNPLADEVCDGLDNDCDELTDDDDPTLDMDSAPLWYADNDLDTFGDPALEVARCERPVGGVNNDDDCDDGDPDIHPNAQEVCDGVDNDCDYYVDDSDPDLDTNTLTTWYADLDGDGFGDPESAVDTCQMPWFYADNALDCDDEDAYLGPIDTAYWSFDEDGDGFGVGSIDGGPSCTAPEPGMVPVLRPTDCDDEDPDVHPEADEICNGIDDDCDDDIDDEDDDLDTETQTTWFMDEDGDEFGDAENTGVSCDVPSSAVLIDGDCNDNNAAVNPDATEICNDGVDDDCDGEADDDDPELDVGTLTTWFVDADEDGYGAGGSEIETCNQPTNYVDNGEDCDDTDPMIGPPSQWAEDTDEDGFPSGDGVGDETCFSPGPGFAPTSLEEDCLPLDPGAYPGAPEVCGDGIDQDCSGSDLACGTPRSCVEVLALNPDAPSGVYTIEPHEEGVYEVYCDMTTDDGGWTLVASSTEPVSDQSVDWTEDLMTLSPADDMVGVWRGMRLMAPGDSDIRFACKDEPLSVFMRVDLSFYAIHWYDEITTGEDFQSCFSEGDGVGYDDPAPARRNNLTGAFRALGDDWDADGYLEGESSCSTSDFTIDFDDRGVDGDPSDGTDWGYDTDIKCGTEGSGGAWFIFVRE